MSDQTFGIPPAFRNFTPSGPTLTTAVTSKQAFLKASSIVPGSSRMPDARIYSQYRNTLNNNHNDVNSNSLKIGTLAAPKTTVTRNRILFPAATRSNPRLSVNNLTTSVGLTLRNVRPCPETARGELDSCGGIKAFSVYDFADNTGGSVVAAPFGQSLESNAEYCCNGELLDAGPVTSSASSQGNGLAGFVKNTLDGAPSAQGYNLPSTSAMGAFFGKNNNDSKKGANDGRLVWLSNQFSAYDSNNNIKGRNPYQSQLNPVIFTNSNSDFYSQSY